MKFTEKHLELHYNLTKLRKSWLYELAKKKTHALEEMVKPTVGHAFSSFGNQAHWLIREIMPKKILLAQWTRDCVPSGLTPND